MTIADKIHLLTFASTLLILSINDYMNSEESSDYLDTKIAISVAFLCMAILSI